LALASLGSKRVVTYAVADIHGRLDLLNILLDMITADAAARGARAKIVFTGDYVDRGRDSYGVIERLIAGPERNEDEFICLLGSRLGVVSLRPYSRKLPQGARRIDDEQQASPPRRFHLRTAADA
jgi:hypothetical protein